MTTGTRDRVLDATVALLSHGGREAVTTRAVSERAGVQPPAIYRLFGDKQGLLEAAAAYGFARYLDRKSARPPSADPVDDLRRGWDEHVALGLDNPALYRLMYAEPRPGTPPAAATEAYAVLGALIRRIAVAGRLAVTEERAAQLVHAAGHGVTLTLIAQPEGVRDPALPALAREAVIAAITTDERTATPAGPVGAAVALRAALPRTTVLTGGERALFDELVLRLADDDAWEPVRE